MSDPPRTRPTGLSPATLRWLQGSDSVERKSRGQYMTPRPVAEALLNRVMVRPGMNVLDPGVGTGELLRAALDREPGLDVTGWDVDQTAIEVARELVPEALLEIRSALEPSVPEQGFDLVIGNPPYFQLKLGRAERKRFAGVISGRANIFALFFQVGLELLRPGGELAYIVPPSMNSGAYFEALREHLTGRAEVKDLTILEGAGIFEGANTAVQLLVLEKHRPGAGRTSGEDDGSPTPSGFVLRREVPDAGFQRVILTPDPIRLAGEFENRRTLWELGLEAVTGQVIWNENRERLVEEEGPGRVQLIWSRDIGAGELRPVEAGKGGSGQGGSGAGVRREEKPGFYDCRDGGKAPLTGPAIVVNRVVGAVGRGELRAALIPAGQEFLAENHVNVIRPRTDNRGGSDSRREDRKPDPPGSSVDWEAVLASLRKPGVVERVRLLTGNTQISARELTHLLPLD